MAFSNNPDEKNIIDNQVKEYLKIREPKLLGNRVRGIKYVLAGLIGGWGVHDTLADLGQPYGHMKDTALFVVAGYMVVSEAIGHRRRHVIARKNFEENLMAANIHPLNVFPKRINTSDAKWFLKQNTPGQ